MGLKYKLTAEERATLARNGIVKLASGEVVSQVAIDRDDEAERLNTEARQRRQAAEAQQRAEDERRREAELDVKLQPRKDLERHRWLAAHPERTGEDFEQTWRLHLKPVALAEMRDEAERRTREALLSSAAYGL